jgi:hypothetical protein
MRVNALTLIGFGFDKGHASQQGANLCRASRFNNLNSSEQLQLIASRSRRADLLTVRRVSKREEAIAAEQQWQ